MRLHRLLPLLLLLPLIGHGEELDLTQPFYAEFSLELDGLTIGRMERSLHPDPQGKGFILEHVMYTTGLVSVFKDDRFTERSWWRLEEGWPQPQHYLYRHTNGSKETVERLEFDWQASTVASLRDNKWTTLPITPQVLDKLDYQIQLRRDLAAGKQHIEYAVADRSKIREYRFQVLGEEQLETPMGLLRTLKVERISNNKERKTRFWAAIDFGYVFIQLEQEDDGHTIAGRPLKFQQGIKPVEAAER